MRRLLYILVLALLPLASVQAQMFYTGTEYGVTVGGTQYFGDLNDNYGFQTITPAVGAFTRIHMNPFISVRLGANITRVSYKDKFSNHTFNKTRNLDFTSNIVEAAVFTEFNFFRFMTGEADSRWTPYLVGGVGVFYYSPYTHLDGRKYNLRDLGTEGQYSGYVDRSYSNISFMFPVGVGFKYWIRPGVNFGFEIADRLTLTDYLDDVSATYAGAASFQTNPGFGNAAFRLQDRSTEVSNVALGREGKQRGNSTSTDQYLMFSFKLSFQLRTYKCPTYLKQGYMY